MLTSHNIFKIIIFLLQFYRFFSNYVCYPNTIYVEMYFNSSCRILCYKACLIV